MCLYRLSEGAYKAVLSSFGLVYTTRSDHNIQFKSLSSPCQRFLNSAIVCYSLLKCQLVPKALQKPEVRWLYRLSKGANKASLPSLGLVCTTRYPSVCQKPQRGHFSTVFSWPRMTRLLKQLSKTTIWNVCYLQ